MPRSATFALLFLAATVVRGETLCRESEVTLDRMHSAARLEQCDEGEVPSSLLWHLDRIDQIAPSLDGRYDRSNRGAGSVIYVMDTGVLASHSEFAGPTGSRVIAGLDAAGSVGIGASRCTSENRATAPCYADFDELASASHGTGVASVAAGKNIGVAPESSVVSVRVMNERGLATTRTYLDGLNAIVAHAWSAGVPRTSVVNISGWVLERLDDRVRATDVPFAAVERKMREMISGVGADGTPDANGRRFLFVVAANNTESGCGPSGLVDRFPATLGSRIEGMLTVGGMTSRNTTWQGSCRGGVEVLAPAEGIFSATITAADHYRGTRPNLRNGTSFAAPVVAGIAARLLSERPDLTPQQVEAWIEASPSRVWDPSPEMAEGKVAYVRSLRERESGTAEQKRRSSNFE